MNDPQQKKHELKLAVEKFIADSDKSDKSAILNTYSPGFLNVRITNKGEVVRLDRDQIVNILGNLNGWQIPTQSTTLQHLEVLEDNGFVLLTRIKDMGNGWESIFYSLDWKWENGRWFFLPEFVHQKSLPKKRSDTSTS